MNFQKTKNPVSIHSWMKFQSSEKQCSYKETLLKDFTLNKNAEISFIPLKI